MALAMQLFILGLLPVAFLLPRMSQGGEIIGGHEAKPHSRPYMAYLDIQRGGKRVRCGGFLVAKIFVLTAAHCDGDEITVKLGAHNIVEQDWSQQKIPVHRRIPHPQFNKKTLDNDIMLLQLRHEARMMQAVSTIPLSNREVTKGTLCSVAGWGQTSAEANARPSPTLQEVELKVMGQDICMSLPYQYFNPAKMLCVGDPEERKASFRGDSGGPLVCDGKAMGIVSYGRNNGSAPRVFTKVSRYVHWIRKILHDLKP